jgi:single-strand DNA-binding protein
LWRGLAEVADKYVKKGTQIYVEGRIRTRSWDDRDGNKRYTTEIVGDIMQLLGKKSDDTSGAASPPSGQDENMNNTPDIPEADAADDLPF